jgi:hypothetical protein
MNMKSPRQSAGGPRSTIAFPLVPPPEQNNSRCFNRKHSASQAFGKARSEDY